MNAWQALKAWRTLKREWRTMETRLETKPGYKTTEFWITVTAGAASMIGGVVGILPPEWAVIAGALSAGLYTISRGLAKQGIDPNLPTGGK